MLTLNDGRSELWQWDTGRTLAVDADCSQVHFSNKVFGRSIDVDVVDGVATIPDILLQTDNDLNVWAFVGTAENGYTKISKTFKVNRRNKPADYVFTPPDQTTLAELSGRLDRIEESQDPEAIKNAVEDYLAQNPVEIPVQSVNGQTGAVELNAEDVGAIAETELPTAINTALAQAKESGEFDGADGAPGKDGADGQPGKDGTSPVVSVSAITGGHRINITDVNGTKTVDVMDGSDGKNGADGKPGADGSPGQDGRPGADGVGIQSVAQTTTSTEDGGTNIVAVTKTDGTSSTFSVKNGSKGSTGQAGAKGADGKSAYQYAQEGGYTGTETEFAKKLASETVFVNITESNGTLSADKTFTEIRDAIIAGISVLVDYGGTDLPLIAIAGNLFFGTVMCDKTSVATVIIEITENGEVNDISSQADRMPNPNPLVFTGAVTGAYDGTSTMTVKIPSAVTDDHINSLIDAKLGVIENGSY